MLPLPLLPPHPDRLNPAISRQSKARHERVLLRFRCAPLATIPKIGRPEIGNHSASLSAADQIPGSASRAELPAVVTMTFTDVALEPLRVTELEERAQVAWAGAPLQLRQPPD